MAAAGGSYAPVSKESVADDDIDADALNPRQREQSDAESSEPGQDDGGRHGESGCDCLTALLAKLREGGQRGYAAPEEGVTARLTPNDDQAEAESDDDDDGGQQRRETRLREAGLLPEDEGGSQGGATPGERLVTLRKGSSGFGMVISPDATIASVDLDGPAARAGVSANARIIAVQGTVCTLFNPLWGSFSFKLRFTFGSICG